MKTQFIECESPAGNWGKFMIATFTEEEWARKTTLTEELKNISLLTLIGVSKETILVFDLQTGEGAYFKIGGSAKADLNKHKIWVCILFEPFLEWLYKQKFEDIQELPKKVVIDFPLGIAGYRREGVLTLHPRMNVSKATLCLQANRKITKIELRNACKKHPNYRIKIDNGGVDGATEDREIIPIDTLGKWLFGVSGYKGHIIVMEGSENGEIYLPNECPQEAIKMIKDCINT